MTKTEKKQEYDLWWAIESQAAGLRTMQIAKSAGGSGRLFEMEKEELLALKGIGERAADRIIYRRNCWNYEKALQSLQETGIRFVSVYDPDYPKRLHHTPNPPFALFVKGSLPEDHKPAVAIVGARECSEYGRYCASYFARGLTMSGVNVLSGMAIGIDGIAQQAALNAGGRSFAVLGNGPDICYPPANRKLYDRLVRSGGLISEYGPHVSAVAWHFPARNRILAGLCDIVLVVEAREKSGTLITADMALDAGRDVMIVPGRITDPLSVGCIGLWENGACPACNVSDVLEVLSGKGFSVSNEGEMLPAASDDEIKLPLESMEKLVYSGFDFYARSAEEVMENTKLPYQDFLQTLMKLEMKGLIKETGRGYYVRVLNTQEDEHG